MKSPLISATNLAALLARQEPVVILDARAGDVPYREGHLSGAQRADLETHLSGARDAGADPARGGRHPLPSIERWAAQLGVWGIAPETSVVIYDDQNGANAAARAWWMLRGAGHEATAVLDGGFAAAVAAGVPVTSDVALTTPAPNYPATRWLRPTVDLAAVDAIRADRERVLLDVRAAPRFRGETEPIDPIAGHIPGAVNIPYEQNWVDPATPQKLARREVRDSSGMSLRPVEQLKALYAKLDPDKETIVYCQSGARASQTAGVLQQLGFKKVKVYDASWLGYGNTLDAPANNVTFFNVGLLNGRVASMQNRIETLERELAETKAGRK